MRTLYLILLLIAAVCFALAAFYRPTATDPARPSVVSRVNLVALGLLAWVLVPTIQTIDSFD